MSKFIQRLQTRWGITSVGRVIIILIVFALTGTTVLVIKPFLFKWLNIDHSAMSIWYNILYLILILPFYNALLLLYGFLFGQFRFFLDFEKKFFRRMFRRSKKS
jgi:hypothetical protein